MIKKGISLILAVMMLAGMLSVNVFADEMLGLNTLITARKNADIYPGTVIYDILPENGFSFEGRKFSFLGGYIGTDGINHGYRVGEDGKCYYLVIANEPYGRHGFDLNENGDHVWDPEVPGKLAYYLNNEFISEEYVPGTDQLKLPDEIIENLGEYNWHCEPTLVEGYTSEFAKVSKVALPSDYEYMKYAGKYPLYGAKGSWMRTAGARGNGSSSRTAMSVTGERKTDYTEILTNQWIRPIFWLGEDFFINNKIDITDGATYIAKCLALSIDMDKFLEAGVYTEDELKAWIPAPEAEIIRFGGNPVEGDKISLEYGYSSSLGFDEGETLIQWLVCDTPDGEYIPVTGENDSTYIVRPEDDTKYIKASVTPKSKSLINNAGTPAVTTTPIGPIYGSTQMANVISAIDALPPENVMAALATHNVAFGLDLAMTGLTPGEQTDAVGIFSRASLTDFDTLTRSYNNSMKVAMLNTTANDNVRALQLVTDVFTQEELSQFDTLENQDFVLAAVSSQGYQTISEFEDDFFDNVTMGAINEASRENIVDVLKTNIDMFTSDLSSFDDYQLGIVGSNILGSYADFSVLDGAVTSAVQAVLSQGTVTAPESGKDAYERPSYGGGGGGGGGGTVSVRPATPVVMPQVVPEETSGRAPGEYDDIDSSHWAFSAVKALSEASILAGDGKGFFRPDDTVTREEFVKMAVVAFEIAGSGSTAAFKDVDASAWYADYVNRAVSAGIITGVSDVSFGTGGKITRQDMAVIVYRIVKDKLLSGYKVDFLDSDQIAEYAKAAIDTLAHAEIFTGDDHRINPHGTATRAMAAKLIYNALAKTGGLQ